MPNKNIEVEIKLSPEVREMIEGELLPALAEVARLAAELAQAKHRVATLIAEKGRELNAEALCAENDRLTAEVAALRVVADRDALQVIAQYERAQQAEAEVARIVRERDALREALMDIVMIPIDTNISSLQAIRLIERMVRVARDALEVQP